MTDRAKKQTIRTILEDTMKSLGYQTKWMRIDKNKWMVADETGFGVLDKSTKLSWPHYNYKFVLDYFGNEDYCVTSDKIKMMEYITHGLSIEMVVNERCHLDPSMMLTVKAIDDSINKWTLISAGKKADMGGLNCKLCQTQSMQSIDGCAFCPIAQYTGKPNCEGSPYAEWIKHHNECHKHTNIDKNIILLCEYCGCITTKDIYTGEGTNEILKYGRTSRYSLPDPNMCRCVCGNYFSDINDSLFDETSDFFKKISFVECETCKKLALEEKEFLEAVRANTIFHSNTSAAYGRIEEYRQLEDSPLTTGLIPSPHTFETDLEAEEYVTETHWGIDMDELIPTFSNKEDDINNGIDMFDVKGIKMEKEFDDDVEMLCDTQTALWLNQTPNLADPLIHDAKAEKYTDECVNKPSSNGSQGEPVEEPFEPKSDEIRSSIGGKNAIKAPPTTPYIYKNRTPQVNIHNIHHYNDNPQVNISKEETSNDSVV